MEQKPPEIFILTIIMRISRSGLPPVFFPCRFRKLLGAGLANPSLDGGLPLLRLFFET